MFHFTFLNHVCEESVSLLKIGQPHHEGGKCSDSADPHAGPWIDERWCAEQRPIESLQWPRPWDSGNRASSTFPVSC